MANRDGKLILRTLKNISASISVDGGGGTKVVTELPEVGEEHTIYELHQNVPPAYNWVVMCTHQMITDDVDFKNDFALIFDTYEQMTSIFSNIDINDSFNIYCYLRNEDKFYYCYVENSSLAFAEQEKVASYTFIDENDNIRVYVLKSYEGLDTTDNKYYGRLIDNTRVSIDPADSERAFILHQATYDWMNYFQSRGQFNFNPVTQLPTAQEAVANYLDELVENEGYITVEIEGQLKWNFDMADNYQWSQELENFYQPWEEGGEPIDIYTGPLEWEDVSNPTFDTIPYQAIMKNEVDSWIFQPKKGGELVTSYWIYTNNEWVNIDEIGELDTITIPVKSIDGDPGLIPLSKIHFYLDNKELDLVTVQSEDPEIEDCGYLIVPLLNSVNATYPLHIVFDFDESIVVGGDCTLQNNPVFISVEENPHIEITSDTTEYDFNIYVGYLVLFNGIKK